MVFANTTYLWGLLGLLIPIAIHLWSRKKVITIKVGSTKLLQSSEPKQTSSVKINEWWLLFLRLLIVLLLTLILSEPNIPGTEQRVKINYLIEPSLVTDNRMVSILDTLPKESLRLLKKGFPFWEESKQQDFEEVPSYWQLAHEMKTIPADSIVVFSRGYLKGVKGARPVIQANTKWISVEPEGKEELVISATAKKELEVLSAFNDESSLFFKKDTVSMESDAIEMNLSKDSIRLKSGRNYQWMALQNNDPIRVGVIANDTLVEQIEYLEAAYKAISKFLNRPVEVQMIDDLNSVSTSDFEMLISLNKNVPKNYNGKILSFTPDEFSAQLIKKGPSEKSFYLTRPLDSENIVSEHLPEKLIALLDLNKNLEDRILESDLRVLPETQLQPIRTSKIAKTNEALLFEVTPILWFLLLLILVVERILSKVRRQ